MAAMLQHALTIPSSAAAGSLGCRKSEIVGSSVQGLPVLKLSSSTSPRSLKVIASGGKKVSVKEPYGPSGGTKFRGGLDASGRKAKGKGVYQFGKNTEPTWTVTETELKFLREKEAFFKSISQIHPIYAPEEWSPSGDAYAGGQTGLLLWAVTLGALLLGGAILVYNTSALV